MVDTLTGVPLILTDWMFFKRRREVYLMIFETKKFISTHILISQGEKCNGK